MSKGSSNRRQFDSPWKGRKRALRGERAGEKPLAVREHRPHLEVALPLDTLIADLTGDDVARARDRG